ncbi:major facilitator superfamily domain-containing protein, partial [Scheffersomyces xylosifermentans]|uniref:major facilitator superfamily domain-containing protein n=1 Tax=Scheffersomyces xylosifermentans TaxID=1304137 RepID=UPI00315D29C1
MSISNPPKNKWRVFACIALFFGCGFSDAAPGALLPTIESYYGINYSIASLIWVANAGGFIIIACFSDKLQPWFDRRNSLVLGCVLCCIMYAIISSGADHPALVVKYPAIVFAFLLGGAGFGTLISQCNVFISRLEGSSLYLSYLHGSYGIGATISPLVVTTMVGRGIPWHYFYMILLGIMIANCMNIYFAFTGADKDLLPWEESVTAGFDRDTSDDRSNNGFAMQTFTQAQSQPQQNTPSDMVLALKNPV